MPLYIGASEGQYRNFDINDALQTENCKAVAKLMGHENLPARSVIIILLAFAEATAICKASGVDIATGYSEEPMATEIFDSFMQSDLLAENEE